MAGMSRSLPIADSQFADSQFADFAVHSPTHHPHADFAVCRSYKEDRIGSES